MSNAERNLDAKRFVQHGTAVVSIATTASSSTLFAASAVASIGALNTSKSNFSWMCYVFNKSTTNDVHVNVYNQGDTSSGTHAANLGDRVVPPGSPGFFHVPEGSGQGIASCIADTAACNVVVGWFLRSKT